MQIEAPKIQPEKRTSRQNRSLHLWATMIADTLNVGGFDQNVVMTKVSYSVPNTMESVKDIYRTFANAMYGVKSTTELTTKQFSEVAEVINRELSEKLGVTLPEYPSELSLQAKMRGWRRSG